LSDVDGRLTGALRLPTFTTGGVIYLTRVTLVTAEGCIAHTFYPVPDPSRHAAEVLAWIKGRGEWRQSPMASSSASSTE
jgi:peroxiredoxin